MTAGSSREEPVSTVDLSEVADRIGGLALKVDALRRFL
jgi:hypothetical protein